MSYSKLDRAASEIFTGFRENELIPRRSNFTFIDLFAGIGGMRLAFESIGGSCVFSSEWDLHSQKTYSANFGDVPMGDITKIASSEIPVADVVLAGFPCQPFSTFGKRAGFAHETQGTLFYDVLRVIKENRPRAFLLENVKGLLSHDRGRTISVIRESLLALGYQIAIQTLNSANYGLPQVRERIFIVGFDNNSVGDAQRFLWPAATSEQVAIGPFIEHGVGGYEISKHLQASYIHKLDDGRPQIVTADSDFPVKTLVASYHKVQRLSGTFVADGPTGLRLLSEAECKAIMGFPSHFKFPVSRTQMYRQLGNSVAVPVVSAIASEMLEVLYPQSEVEQTR